MSTEPTTVLGGRYQLEGLLGRGGMADVYRATDQVLDRPVALKVMREMAADESDRARFTHEAMTLAGLNHVGLVTVLDAATTGDQPYLVMELVDGTNLAEHCAGRPLPPQRVAEIGGQVADALAYAHDAGVVHRDVKPANVLLADDGRAKLSDFGVARLMADTARHTRTGMTIGSPAYLAPEQVRGDDVTQAADMYSLGLVLLEALTGRRAYTGSATEAALARLSTPPAVPDELPAGWRTLLERMTDLDPTRRPTAADVAAALRELRTGEEGRTRVVPSADGTRVLAADGGVAGATSDTMVIGSRPEAGDRFGTGWLRRARWALLGLAAVLLVVVLLVLALSGGPDTSGSEVPDGVPPRFEEPLRDLHDAVHGGAG